MISISRFFHKISTGKVTLAATVLFILFSILVLPKQSTSSSAGEPVDSPDLSFYYTKDDLYRMANDYGEQGRIKYIQQRFSFDIIWPVVYGLFLVTAISWLSSQSFIDSRIALYGNLIPLLGVIFDFLENLSTSLVIYRFPSRTSIVDTLAPIITTTKWIFIASSFIILMVYFIVWMTTKLRGSQK